MRSLAFLLLLVSTLAAAGEEIRLWPNGAPGSENMTSEEKVERPDAQRSFVRVTNIHKPSITPYLPKHASGAAVVIAPGGGHRMLAMHEGYDIGEWLASKGVAGFVLKYRLARETNSPYKVDVHPVDDARRAIRLVRSRAREWGVDPERIGIMGFSAGGEVALRASMTFDSGNDSAPDVVERQSSRPAFQALIYPGIRSVPYDGVRTDMPPAFLTCAHDDRSPAETIPNLYLALLKAGVPAEVHIYARGGHGYGIRQRPLPVTHWTVRFEEWLADQGFLKK
jgi:endo-1,4-beta-xylanase